MARLRARDFIDVGSETLDHVQRRCQRNFVISPGKPVNPLRPTLGERGKELEAGRGQFDQIDTLVVRACGEVTSLRRAMSLTVSCTLCRARPRSRAMSETERPPSRIAPMTSQRDALKPNCRASSSPATVICVTWCAASPKRAANRRGPSGCGADRIRPRRSGPAPWVRSYLPSVSPAKNPCRHIDRNLPEFQYDRNLTIFAGRFL